MANSRIGNAYRMGDVTEKVSTDSELGLSGARGGGFGEGFRGFPDQ